MSQPAELFNATLDALLSRLGPRAKRGNAFKIARKAGFELAKSARIEGSNAEVCFLNGRWKITVNKYDPGPVQQFLVAHEMLELLLPEGLHKEELCRMGASLLLMPRGQLEGAYLKLDFDLYRLKELFPFLSFQGLALRSLAVTDGIVTAQEDEGLVFRVATWGQPCPENFSSVEAAALTQARITGTKATSQDDRFFVTCWPFREKGSQGYILLARVRPGRIALDNGPPFTKNITQ